MSKMYENGVSKCYLYPVDSTVQSGTPYVNGVPWVGITSVQESPPALISLTCTQIT